MIKIGTRKNLIYPIMLLLCITLRRIIEILLKIFLEETNYYLLPFLIFSSQFVFGLFSTFFINYKQKSNKINRILGIELIYAKNQISEYSSDSKTKILILVIFASYFNCIGTMIRKKTIKGFEVETLDNRLRSFQIIISSILCYFALRIKMYKHNIFTLIIISICSIIIIIIFFVIKGINWPRFELFGHAIISCFLRAFLDTIEKYLYEFDYVSPFKMLMGVGFVSCSIITIIFLISPSQKDGNPNKDENLNMEIIDILKIIFSILLLVLYLILSGFKNIYRVITIKLYSPMTRALAETIIDPIIVFVLYFLKDDQKKEHIWYISINLLCLILIVFCSFVYNDFIILYCFGLEHDTYTEITKRANEINNIILGEDNDNDNDNDSDDGGVNIELQTFPVEDE